MLKRGFLVSTVIYISYAHKKKIIDEYLKNVSDICKIMAKNKSNINDLLEQDICHDGFQRLN